MLQWVKVMMLYAGIGTAVCVLGCDRQQPKPPAAPSTTQNQTPSGNPHGGMTNGGHTHNHADGSDEHNSLTTRGGERREQPQPPENPKVAEFLGLRGPKPAAWTWHPPKSRYREVNWTVPGQGTGDSAEFIVFHFPHRGGGPVERNIYRWTQQFRGPDGEPPQPIVNEMTVDGMPVTIVELEGRWQPMGSPSFQKDQMAIFAVIKAPVGKVFLRFGGPRETIEANRDDVMALIEGLKIVDESAGKDPT